MKTILLALAGTIALPTHSIAQVVVPATPGKFKARPIGGGISPGVEVIPKESIKPIARYTTYIVLSESRIWSASDGRTIKGKLIAFEDLVAETPKGSAEPAIPPRPDKPTVVRAGKARLIVNKKTFEIELSKLHQADQEFVRQIEAAITQQAETQKTP